MKVYGIFKIEYQLPWATEHLVELRQFKDDADIEVERLNRENPTPPEGDDYGYYSGSKYGSVELEVK